MLLCHSAPSGFFAVSFFSLYAEDADNAEKNIQAIVIIALIDGYIL